MPHRPQPFTVSTRVAPAIAALLLSAGVGWAQQPPATTPSEREPAAEPGPRPLLQVVDREVDLGTLYRGDEAEARFELRNVGDAPLHIQRVKPG
jgi:hypothetical protein